MSSALSPRFGCLLRRGRPGVGRLVLGLHDLLPTRLLTIAHVPHTRPPICGVIRPFSRQANSVRSKEESNPAMWVWLVAAILRADNFGVCTLSTLWASDRAVLESDRAGFRMFPGEPSVCGGGNAVRVPPRARVSLFRGLWAAECVQISFYGPLRGPIFVAGRCALAAPSLGLDSGVAAYPFMAGSAWNCMTC